MDRAITTEDIRTLLQAAHPSGEWALLFEVAPQTGGGTRYADAVAINLWKSRGYAVHGFEIKVSRSDWLRELKQPEKAEDVMSYCDNWWLVTLPGVVKEGELPPGWGLMEVSTKRGAAAAVTANVNADITQTHKFTITIKAARLKARPVSREFFASLIRRANEVIERTADRRYMIERMNMQRDIEKRISEQVDARSRRASELEAQVKQFTEKTGVEFTTYSGPPIEIFELAQKLNRLNGYGQGGDFLGRVSDLVRTLERSAADVKTALEDAAELLQSARGNPTLSAAAVAKTDSVSV